MEISKLGVSAFFICVAVVVEAEHAEALKEQVEKVALRLCGGAEIKSNSIGSNHQRRLQFLESIAPLNFAYYAMLVRKDSVWRDSGLQYKRSFYKCINQILYRRLTRSSRSIRIIADEIGGRDFMDSFKGYLDRKLKPDLFFTCEHQFSNSKQTRLIQLADLIAGTLAHCYEPQKKGEHSSKFRALLRSKELAIDFWPITFASVDQTDNQQEPVDDLRPFLMARVLRFINEKEDSGDSTQRMQVAALKSLLFAREFESSSQQLISSDRLIQQLVDQGFESISKRAFTKEIIGGIRMDGVIIAGTKNGYRLAMTQSDINDYLDHNKSIIEPMLSRLREARKAVKIDTANRVDIVSDPPYRALNRLLDSTSDINVDLEDLEHFQKDH